MDAGWACCRGIERTGCLEHFPSSFTSFHGIKLLGLFSERVGAGIGNIKCVSDIPYSNAEHGWLHKLKGIWCSDATYPWWYTKHSLNELKQGQGDTDYVLDQGNR